MSTREGCCGKQCPSTSLYLCPSSLGGACCGYGSECREGGRCVKTVEPTTTGAPGLTPVPEGCTTSQYKCEDGEGCCNIDQKCTEVSNTAYCAAGTPTGSNIEFIDGDDDVDDGGGGGGLSAGAQAGIGIGATVGAGILIGLLAWLCISRRRKQRSAQSQRTGDHSLPTIGAGAGVGAGATAGAGYNDDNMTEYTETSRPWQTNARGGGPTQDYFGPSAVAGPFTDNPLSPVDHQSPPLGAGRAVPSQPQKPGDIAAPVEIDSTGRTPGTDDGGWLSPNSFSDFQTTPMPEGPQGRVELYGSDADPQLSPPTPPRDEYLRR